MGSAHGRVSSVRGTEVGCACPSADVAGVVPADPRDAHAGSVLLLLQHASGRSGVPDLRPTALLRLTPA